MSSDYSLFVHTVDGIVWKPGKTHGKTPNLYVAIYRDGIEIQRTRTVKRELAPTWDHLSKISSSSSVISLRLFHDSSVPFARDKCLGIVDIDVPTLKNLCVSNSDAKVVKLELKGVDGEFKGKPAGTVSVWLISDAEAAALAAQKAQKDVQNIGLPATISTPVAAGGSFEEAASTASELGSALASVASKLEIIVRIGDELATIHPYANIAWKVLTSVYQAVKKQHERDKKLIKLVETMAEVYSFVTDVDFLPERIQSLEDKALAIVKQTVECALFIQEYTANGFCARAIRNTWLKADKKIDELSETLLKLKESFDGRLTVQSVFISTKVLEKVESLEQSDTLKKLNPVDMNASLRAACLPGTRREILDEITGWLTVPSDTGNILWLSGVAGSGKSTISTTVSESFRAVDRLGAFLFFDRNDVSRSHPAGVIRTMAHSLALANPHIGSAISAVIGRDPAVVNAPMPTQFRQLLLEPLRSAEQNIHGPILIILDALDECGDPESRATLLSLLSDEFPKLPRLLRFLITSRREADITDQFGSRFVEMDLATGALSSTQDVELYLRHEISQIQARRKLGAAWPGEVNIRTLVHLSGGLFIWASTASKFLNGYRPDERLKILIGQEPTRGFNLDTLYGVALHHSAPWEDKTFAQDARAVLACVVLGRVPMSNGTIDMLLYSGQQNSGEVLKYLACVVQWSPGQEARTLHTSFADYLTDPNRSGGEPWAINPKVDHYSLSAGCLRILNRELRFNICGLKDSHHRNADVVDMPDRVARLISPQLSYASCFWFTHIHETLFDTTILEGAETFLRRRFLYWLEVLSLLGQIPIAAPALRGASQYYKDQNSDLENFITDAIRFIVAFGPAIAQSAPHIYLSALPFAPQTSRIAKEFIRLFPTTLQYQSFQDPGWPSIQQILYGHENDVYSVHFSPDGTRIVSGSGDCTVRVWDAQTGALVLELPEAHTDSINSVKFSPDGARIASGADDHRVRVWASKTGALVAGPFEHAAQVLSVDFAPNGTRIASGVRDGTIHVWDANTGTLVVRPFEGHKQVVSSIQFSPDGAQIVSGSSDCTVCVWDAETGTLVAGPFQGHTSSVNCVKFALNGTQIASGSDDGTVRVWHAQTGALVAGPFVPPLQVSPVKCVTFSPDGAWIAAGSRDALVRIWDVQPGGLMVGLLDGHGDSVESVDFSSDGMQITTGSNDTTVRVWNAQTSTFVGRPFNGHSHGVTSLRFSPDGTRIASGSTAVCIWNAQTGALVVGPIDGHSDMVLSVDFSPDSARIAAGGADSIVHVWDSQTGALLAGPFTGHIGVIRSVQFSPDGTRILSASEDQTVRVWDAQTGETVAGPFEGHCGFLSARFSPDGLKIVGGSDGPKVYVWDVQTGALAGEPFDAQTEYVFSVHFSPDGSRIAGGCGDNTVRVWDAQTGILVAGPFKGHTGRVFSVQFSPDGTRIASGASDNTVRVWDAQTGALVAGPFGGHTYWVLSVSFSPDGKHIASASVDATVRVWEMNSCSVASPLGDYPSIEDGWVRDSAGNLMFWVPPWLRDGLYHPRNSLVICRQGTTRLNLTRFVHGTEWEQCIDPKFRDTKSDTN